MDFQDLLGSENQLNLLISGILVDHPEDDMPQLAEASHVEFKALTKDLETIYTDLSNTATPELTAGHLTRNHLVNLRRLYLQRSKSVKWIQTILRDGKQSHAEHSRLIALIFGNDDVDEALVTENTIRGWLTNLTLAVDDDKFGLVGWRSESQAIFESLTKTFNLHCKKSTADFLRAWIRVSLSRIQGKHFMTGVFVRDELPENLRALWDEVAQIIKQPIEGPLVNEIGAIILSGLVFCDELPENTLIFEDQMFDKMDELAWRVSSKIYQEILFQPDVEQSKLKQIDQDIIRAVINLHRRDWLTGGQLDYAPLPGMLSEQLATILTPVHEGLAQLPLYDVEQATVARLEPQYDALLSQLLPLNLIKRPVHIVVDFQKAPFWTAQITQQIAKVSQLPVVIDEQPDENTDITITDGYSSVDATQLVWMLPPTNSDWQIFAKTLLKKWQGVD
ncbi:hypothetical protein BSQ39_11130 [Loigolactobacillus backii]|uniref:hypothetical protein n=1 Tax=Loigolactobacillus backii TaxID=375175 RepID=UPI000C1C8E97|nr:hypothetical protein [Loigolactobacillus backii]PIO84070.1 hypothetical protein BSQ39_11130 [Loigolactobacillus backii]